MPFLAPSTRIGANCYSPTLWVCAESPGNSWDFSVKCILNASILINISYFTADFISWVHVFVCLCFVHAVWFSAGVTEWLQSPALNLLIFAQTTRSTWPVATTTVTDCWPNVIWDETVAAHPLKAVHTQFSIMCNTQRTVAGIIFQQAPDWSLLSGPWIAYTVLLHPHQSPNLSHLVRC